MNKSILQVLLLLLIITILSITPPGGKPLFTIIGGTIIDSTKSIIFFWWNLGRTIEDWGSAITNFKKVLRERVDYKEKLNLLRTLNLQIERLRAENKVLRDLWKIQELPVNFNFVGARVIGTDFSIFSPALILDRGVRDGIVEGLPLLYGGGVAGKVVRVFETTSLAVLTNNEDFAIGGVVDPGGEMGVVRGGKENLNIEFLSLNPQVQVGQLIVSSSSEGIFGLPIGIIKSLDIIGKITPSAKIEPLVNPAGGRFFLIVLGINPD
ncbi:MAG: hypothetical protein DDT23_00274 [candidate division WS2 bacterium]|nr:hypothetical protein [Candidatus Lithacetigena glycinireducens]